MDTLSGDVLVVGSGIFGVTAALELRERGHTVTLLDPGPLPAESASSTDVSKMVRMDYGADRFYHELAEVALEGWDRWNASWESPLYHESGFLVLSREPMAPGGFEYESLRVLSDRGYAPTRIAGRELRSRFPRWRDGSHAEGYLSARGGWVESGAVVAAWVRACQAAGVRFHFDRCTGLLQESGGTVVGVTTAAGGEVRAGQVVVAAGAWTPLLVPWLADVMWATGQPVLHFRAIRPDDFRGAGFPPFAADIAGSGWYGFPALDDGTVKVAHHAQGRPVDPDDRGEVGDEHIRRTRRFLSDSIPDLADATLLGGRICLYCDTFDGDLWIDRDPGHAGLVVASGGSGHGFKFAPVLGGIIADVVEGVPNRWTERFRWRTLGARRSEAARFKGR